MHGALDEARRLDILRRYAILDTPPEAAFDRIAWLAAAYFRVPIGIVTFVDETRQWFKAVHGLDVRETGRDIAFCDYSIRQDDVFEVPDALKDERFRDNPLVTGAPAIRFYAGAPLRTREGHKLGTVAVIDTQPHSPLSADERTYLRHLAAMVVEALELRIAAGDVKAEIEERRRTQAELERTTERFRVVVANSPAVLFAQDTDLRYTWVENAPGPPEAFLGRTDADLWPPENARNVIELKREVLRTGERRRADMMVGPQGGQRCYDTMLEPTVEGGRVVGLTGIAFDVTEQRTAKAAVQRALAEANRANRAKTRFLAAASHDLRQPMQSLLLVLGILGNRTRGTPQASLVRSALSAADAMRGLLDDLLDISRIEAGLVQPAVRSVPLAPLLARLESEYAPRARPKGLRFHVRPTAAAAMTDPVLVERILRNLIENAMRYTEAGGVVVACRRRSGMLRIDVVDTGIGLAPEHADAIFDEFVQLDNPERDRTKGLGLGLAIVRRLAALLGHRIEVSSRPGRGSRFSVVLPQAEPAPAPLAAAAWTPSADLSGRVLVIDDDASVLEALGLTLGGWGLEVTTAESADDAAASLAAAPPDAILADYRLRGGTTGCEAVDSVRRQAGRHIPAVLITGDTSPQRLAEAKASGLALLHKPVAFDELRRVIERMLASEREKAGWENPAGRTSPP